MSPRRVLAARVLATILLLAVCGLIAGAILTDHGTPSDRFGEAALTLFFAGPALAAIWFIEP